MGVHKLGVLVSQPVDELSRFAHEFGDCECSAQTQRALATAALETRPGRVELVDARQQLNVSEVFARDELASPCAQVVHQRSLCLQFLLESAVTLDAATRLVQSAHQRVHFLLIFLVVVFVVVSIVVVG